MKNINSIKNFLLTAALALIILVNPVEAKYGKNKVQYRGMDWSYIQTPHFDVYFYEGGESIAYFAADVAEKSYEQISYQLDWRLSKRISVLV
ncbi:MAG: hypothetical protein HOE44_16000, partial [Candidatus Marinimicrobia bacterium]|nr:hypothetical protein [Candidatus Neomarinimicrobiota bacterium]